MAHQNHIIHRLYIRMVITIGKTDMIEILAVIVLTGMAILYFLFHPLKTLKWIAIAIAVLVVGTLAWFFLFMVLMQAIPT